MNFEFMERPMTRSEFEYRLHMLENTIKNGKMSIAPQLFRAMEGLMNVRYLPNGRIDFLSVDEMTRLQANMMSQMPIDTLSNDLDNDEPHIQEEN